MFKISLSFLLLFLAVGQIAPGAVPEALAQELLAVSDDGSRAAAVKQNRLSLFVSGTSAPLWSSELGNLWATDLAISPDGSLVYLDVGDGAFVYDGKTGRQLRQYSGMNTYFRALSGFDRPLLAVYAGFGNASGPELRSLTVHDPADGAIIKKIDAVMRFCYLQPRGVFLAYRIQYQNTVIFNLETGREYHLNTDAAVTAISNGGGLALVSDKLSYDRLLRLPGGEQTGKEQRLPKYRQAVFSEDDKFILLDCEREILILDTENFELAARLPAGEPATGTGAKEDPSSITPRYPKKISACFTVGYQHALDKDFNGLQNLQARDKTREQFEFLKKYPAEPFNKYYPARRDVIEEVTASLLRDRLAARDAKSLLKLVKEGYANAEQSRIALKLILDSGAEAPKLGILLEILELKTAEAGERQSALSQLYTLVEKQNNISGLLWFLEKYPHSAEAPAALQTLHGLLLDEARRINTLDAYNDFVIACPYSGFLDAAENAALELDKEKSKPGIFSNRDQRARELSARIMRICKKGAALDNDFYCLVVGRMIKMQQDFFSSRPATAQLLREAEITAALEKERSSRAKIAGISLETGKNQSKKAAHLRTQAQIARKHLENAPLDERLQTRYQADRQAWQDFLKAG